MRYTHPTQLPRSKTLVSLEWLGDRIPVSQPDRKGDTHPMTWAADDEIYIGTGDAFWIWKDGVAYTKGTSTDPEVLAVEYENVSGLTVEKLTGDPEHFGLERINNMPGFTGWGGSGPKPCGMISVDGKLYYAVQNLLGWKPPRCGVNSQHGSDATILMSDDFGKTWTPDLNEKLAAFYADEYVPESQQHLAWKTPADFRVSIDGWQPMFPGNWFGGPSFVQFGKDNTDAVDGYVYAVSADHWDNGSDMRLGRVPKDKIQCREAWEFAIPLEDGGVEWTTELYRSEPVLAIERHISLPEMVYIPSIKKYITATWALHEDFHASTGSELTILESDNPWGPFSLVFYEWMWYKQAAGSYCPRIPLKWFDQETLTGYLEHSGNWETLIPYYMPQLHKFQLMQR